MTLFVFPEISSPLKLIFSFVVTLPEHSIQRPPGWLSVRKIINKDYLIPADQKLSKSVSLFHQHILHCGRTTFHKIWPQTHIKKLCFVPFCSPSKEADVFSNTCRACQRSGLQQKVHAMCHKKAEHRPKKAKPWWEEREDYQGPRISIRQRNRSVNSLISGGDNLNRFHEKYSIRAEWF